VAEIGRTKTCGDTGRVVRVMSRMPGECTRKSEETRQRPVDSLPPASVHGTPAPVSEEEREGRRSVPKRLASAARSSVNEVSHETQEAIL
jgi:hypothetical protein